MVAIVDYKLGHMGSIANMLIHIGVDNHDFKLYIPAKKEDCTKN